MSDASAAQGKTLRVGLLAPVHDLSPWGKQDFESTMVLSQIFESPLAQAKGDEPPEPLLLAERPRSDGPDGDGGALVAPVRRDVRFSDGTPLTADLMARSLSRSKVFSSMADVEARGGRLVFRPKRPGARFDLVLSQRFAGVVLEKGGELLGTGPYRRAPGSTPERTRLVKNPEYREPVDIDTVEFVAYPPNEEGRPEALLAAVERGDVDFCNVVSRDDISRLKGVRKWLEPGSGTAILYFNTERPAVRDPRVRRALALGIDRTAVAKICYPNPVAFTATGLVPPMMGSFRDGLSHDPKQAESILRSSDVERPERLTLLLINGPRPYLPQPRDVAENLVEQLGALGVRVEVRQAETLEDYFRDAVAGDYDLALSGWVADTMDPADFLETILAPDSIPTGGRRHTIDGNLSHWRSDAMKGELVRFAGDPSEENKQRILDLLRRETPILPLIYGPTIFVYSPKVMSFKPSPLGIPELGRMKLME
ncbi:MAG: ABC transporter substrate-binding protein [Acidobacteriota bacterium]|jgi:ABC-type transport system substrate-binding protein